MKQDYFRKILHLIVGCATSVAITALGIGLMLSSWSIYQSGPRAYSRESIGAALAHPLIIALIILTALCLLAGIVICLVFPLPKEKTKAIRDEMITMQKLAARAGTPSVEERKVIETEQRNRWLYRVLTAGIYGGLSARPLFYLLDGGNFPGADPTAEIMAAALFVLPPALIGLACCFICSILTKHSTLRETKIYKQIIASGNKITPAPAEDKDMPTIVNTIRCILAAASIAMIIAGIFNGSANDVLTKAIKICTECIGLG